MPTARPQVAPTAVTQSGIAYFTPQFTEAEELAVPLREALGGFGGRRGHIPKKTASWFAALKKT